MASPSPDPAWKRVVGAIVGLLLAVLILFGLRRYGGVSGNQIEEWQVLFVVAAALVGGLVLLLRRYRR